MLYVLVFPNRYNLEPREVVVKERTIIAIDLNKSIDLQMMQIVTLRVCL